jgi:hypothetical protein
MSADHLAQSSGTVVQSEHSAEHALGVCRFTMPDISIPSHQHDVGAHVMSNAVGMVDSEVPALPPTAQVVMVDSEVPALPPTAQVVMVDSEVPALPPTAVQARHAMHSYFARFAGCRNSALEVVPVAAADAELLDLRRALPAVSFPPQFLDLEAVHVHGYSGDSSGQTGESEDGNSLDSFIDDTPVQLSNVDMDFILTGHVAQTLPLTAGLLFQRHTSPATVAASKRRRIILSSSSSSPLPHDTAEVQHRVHISPATAAARKRLYIDITSSSSSS